MKDQGKPLWKIVDERRKKNKRVMVGRPMAFESPDDLWQRAVGYFQWIESNDLEATKVVVNQGTVDNHKYYKMRAMTISGLCLHLGIDQKTYSNYRNKDQFFPVISEIDNIIHEQKFTGAAADLLNANLIARELGLHDKPEIKNLTVQFSDTEEAKRKVEAILDKNPDFIDQIFSKVD